MEKRLRLVFAGTPDFAVPCLQACLDSQAEVVAVYTQPDRPSGRGRNLTAGPVKQLAQTSGIPLEQPDSLRTVDARKRLREWRPDLLVVVAYGLILPQSILCIPEYGCWNVHASLLPRWRGAAPIQRAILAGDGETGVDLMQMEPGLDTGPILLERRTPIADDETGGSLHDRLSDLGAGLLGEAIARLVAGELPAAVAQSGSGIRYAHKLDKAEARLDFNEPALALERKVRAFNPWPVAEMTLAGERLRIWSARAMATGHAAEPGDVLRCTAEGIDIASADGILRILEVQRDGGRRIAVRDWLNARAGLGGLAPGTWPG